MDVLLQRHHWLILQLRKNRLDVPIIELFDDIVLFLNNHSESQIDGLRLLTVICNEWIGTQIMGPFSRPDVMNHEFIFMISRSFKMLLTKATFAPLTTQDEQCFDAMSSFITSLCLFKNKAITCFYTGNNEQLNPQNPISFNPNSYEKIFFTDMFVSKFVRMIATDLCVNEYSPYHVKYKVTDRLLRLWMKLEHTNRDKLIDVCVSCLKSRHYRHTYASLDLDQPMLNPKQSLFMYQCPKFIRLMCDNRQQEISALLCEEMLSSSHSIFANKLKIVFDSDVEFQTIQEKSENKSEPGAKTQAIVWHIELLNYFALAPSARFYFVTSMSLYYSTVRELRYSWYISREDEIFRSSASKW